MTGQSRLAQEWNITATALLNNMQSLLYDNDLNFWIDVIQGTNQPAVGRQLIGYYPYRFGIGTNSTNIQGLETGLNNKHFLTQFGPTTLEQINPYYTAFKNITYCCLWNGQYVRATGQRSIDANVDFQVMAVLDISISACLSRSSSKWSQQGRHACFPSDSVRNLCQDKLQRRKALYCRGALSHHQCLVRRYDESQRTLFSLDIHGQCVYRSARSHPQL